MKFILCMLACCSGMLTMAMEYDQTQSDTTIKSLFPYTVPEYREQMLAVLQNFVYEFDARKPAYFQDIERLVLQQAKLSYPEVYKAYQELRASQQESSFQYYDHESSY
jgi:hypothetical protein